MSKFQITIACDNDAFSGDSRGAELARILRTLAGRLEAGGVPDSMTLRDVNGNHVGSAGFSTSRRS